MSDENKQEVLAQENTLEEAELDAVSGGDVCVCPAAGGGTADSKSKACACVLGGGGEFKDGACRCFCVLAGGGAGEENYS